MARTTKKVQEYIGCLFSMARATLYDHPTYEEAIDQEALDEALEVINRIMTAEIHKNENRTIGSFKHISEISEEVS